MLKLKPYFDLQRDVASDLFRKEASVCRVAEYSGAVHTCILNIEKDGGILYSWKLLYTFDKLVCISSCSLNKEETLLAISLAQDTRGEGRCKPISKCLTLLIEIHPINNTKVLKAVDCRVKVQFLNSEPDRRSVLESHLLLLTEDGYVDLYHVLLTKHEGYRVDKFLMRCVQFYPNRNCETVLELPLDLPADFLRTVKFVNLGFDHFHMERPEQEPVRIKVFTNRIDCSKTFRVSLGSDLSPQRATQLHPLFIPIGYHILVYLQGYFLHCINTRQQEMLCLSLFLSGVDVDLGLQCQSANITVVHAEEESNGSLLDMASGRIYTAELSSAFLLQILRPDTTSRCPSSKKDPQRLAALHCLLVSMGNDPKLEQKIIEWLCGNMNAFESFDQIQEFILGQKSPGFLKSERRPSSHRNNLEENTKKVLSMVDTWCLDKKLVPLFQEEDHQQRALIGLTVDKLREHLNRHLPRMGKKKIDLLVVNYVAKLLELIRHMLESVWLKYKLGPRVLCL
ncbi:Gamma-secretase-activating protein [Liparis tanakae]|uniref:Gamma-secretase-activating protein n=1 Tax=Liparis tanakae TaxID=230148 RepID=A0A4Z2GBS5_9TELE|nr:Gamma-secretase-activating protein [Liparis tanakae]